ncbi:MAG: AzlD domain-containing protein [Pseudomonadota bacterium]
MSALLSLPPGLDVYITLALCGFVATTAWRWAGVLLGRSLDPEGDLFAWVRLVSTALVAGLVTRLVVFPSGALSEVAFSGRVVALVVGVALFYALRRNMAAGVVASATLILAWAALAP